MTQEQMTAQEVVGYWRAILGTLAQRGLLKERPKAGGTVYPEAWAYLLPDRAVYVLDLQRLGGIPRETWLDGNLWAQWRAALQGRRCFVSDGGGLAVTVARQPGDHRPRLPQRVALDLDALPDAPYTVAMGVSKRGRVTLDLTATRERALLVGGTTGGGKTNLLLSMVLQLVTKHGPDALKLAIVDTKQVDFAPLQGLPHLVAPIAHDLDAAAELIERVEAERLARQAQMTREGVRDWRDVEGLPLLVLVVDEAADFAGSPVMATLVTIARLGRAFGVSVVVATQYPTRDVIAPQVRANLPTAIAFQTATGTESRVILGRNGAELLRQPGRALAFVGGDWQEVQTYHVGDALAADVVGELATPSGDALDALEGDMVRYALDHLDGAFLVKELYAAFGDQGVSQYRLEKLGRTWERRGWLTPVQRNEAGHKVGRHVTPALAELVGAHKFLLLQFDTPDNGA